MLHLKSMRLLMCIIALLDQGQHTQHLAGSSSTWTLQGRSLETKFHCVPYYQHFSLFLPLNALWFDSVFSCSVCMCIHWGWWWARSQLLYPSHVPRIIICCLREIQFQWKHLHFLSTLCPLFYFIYFVLIWAFHFCVWFGWEETAYCKGKWLFLKSKMSRDREKMLSKLNKLIM